MKKIDPAEFQRLNTLWLGGEQVDFFKFPHNSLAAVKQPDGSVRTGWIVGAWIEDDGLHYTIESDDLSGDFNCREEQIEVLKNP